MNKVRLNCAGSVAQIIEMSAEEAADLQDRAEDKIADNALRTLKLSIGGLVDRLYESLPLPNRVDATYGYAYKAQIKSSLSSRDYVVAHTLVDALEVPVGANSDAKDNILSVLSDIIG